MGVRGCEDEERNEGQSATRFPVIVTGDSADNQPQSAQQEEAGERDVKTYRKTNERLTCDVMNSSW